MPDTYNPVIRNNPNERQVIRHLGGLSQFTENPQYLLSFEPIIEIGSVDDLEQLEPFEAVSSRVYIDLPEYQTRRDRNFGNQIENTISNFGNRVQFFLQNSKKITNPVISGRLGPPVDYDLHRHSHEGLQDIYDSIAHRLMVRKGDSLSSEQRTSLVELANSLRPTDPVFFDVVDTGFDDDLMNDLEFLAETFSESQRAVLNVFDAFDGEVKNSTPEIADNLGISGFGDFAINVRFPGGGGQGETVTIRHYYPNHAQVEEFEGASYADASNELTDWEVWETDHCDYCRDAARLTTDDPNTWKRIRTGHYIISVLRGEI